MAINRRPPVLDKDLTIPPINPADGSGNYIVPLIATGVWENHGNQIAWPFNFTWRFDVPDEGWLVLVQDEELYYQFRSGKWEALPEGEGILISDWDLDGDGIVDRAASVDDGKGNVATAAQIKALIEGGGGIEVDPVFSAWLEGIQNGNALSIGGALIFGDENTDGSWKFIKSGDNLSVQKRESGVWNEKGSFLI